MINLMNLEKLHDEWEKDCVINHMQLDKTSRDTPILHAKYLRVLTEAKLALKKAERDHDSLMKDKWLYYNGKLSKEDIEEKGWKPDPFDGLKILKGEMDYYYKADPEIQVSEDKKTYFETLVGVLSDIIVNLNWRHQNIKNIIEWKRFESGG